MFLNFFMARTKQRGRAKVEAALETEILYIKEEIRLVRKRVQSGFCRQGAGAEWAAETRSAFQRVMGPRV